MEPTVRMFEAVEVEANKGLGQSLDDPVRRVFYYYEADTGRFLAYRDPWEDEYKGGKEE